MTPLRRLLRSFVFSRLSWLPCCCWRAATWRLEISWSRVSAFTREIEFDFIGWTSDALRLKLFEAALGTNRYLGDDDRKEFVLEYLELVQIFNARKEELEQIYADPNIGDPRAYSAALLKELDELYARRNETGPLAESILQSQISTIVSELGLCVGWAAVAACALSQHSTAVNFDYQPAGCDPARREHCPEGGLSIDQRIELEERVDQRLECLIAGRKYWWVGALSHHGGRVPAAWTG